MYTHNSTTLTVLCTYSLLPVCVCGFMGVFICMCKCGCVFADSCYVGGD